MKGRSEEWLNGFSELLGTDVVIGESQQISKVNSNWFLSVIHTQKIRSVRVSLSAIKYVGATCHIWRVMDQFTRMEAYRMTTRQTQIIRWGQKSFNQTQLLHHAIANDPQTHQN